LVNEAWSLIDVQLKLRYDLIPNLVASVTAYTQHEQNILKEVSALRAKAMENTSPKGKTVPENGLTNQLAKLMIAVENYPELKANEQFLKLQTQLHNIEDQLQMARRYYNGAVRNHNIAIQSFPANLLAALFKFEKFDFFELDSIDERKNVQISFS
jgi:LemA protein